MRVASHINTVIHRVMQSSKGIECIVDTTTIVSSGNAVFSDENRRMFCDIPSMTHSDAEGWRIVFPAG